MSGVVAWITGRPASGKSTFAAGLARALRAGGTSCAVLDGDEVRAALGRPAGRGAEERDAYYEALARLAALLARQELTVIVAATAHRRGHRARARALAPRFLEVHVATPLAECVRRDPKGLYAAARAGAAAGVPGADEPFEEPVAADVTAAGGEDESARSRATALVRSAQGAPG